MTGPELCPKCKGLHFRNAPCVVRKTKPMPHANGTSGGKDELPSAQKQLIAASSEKGTQGFESPVGQFKRGRGRPKTITDMKSYKRDKMREYRAAKKAATEGK